MKRKTNLALELTAIAVMAVVVCVLGLLQYRWTDEIGAGEQDRLKSVLTSSVRSFDQEFSYDFEHICESFEIDPEEPASTIKSRIIRQYSDWLRTTSQANLLGGVMIWRADGKDGSPLEVLDRHDREFAKTAWPPDFAPLYPSLEKQFARLPVLMSGHAATYYPWTFYGDAPALVRPIFKITSEVGESDMEVRPIGFLIVQIDSKFVTGHYFPELAGHDFQPSGFRVAVRTASAPHQAVYLSDASFPVSTPSPDAEINLIKSAGEEAERRGHPSIAAADPARGWELVAQHPAGSMEVAVARWRWENLAISLGLLAVLAASVALVFSVARKAERLGQFQMDFVAGISHELFTPLSVINSVVENLADGLADRPEKIQEYSDILRDQAGRTERLMEQIMLRAGSTIRRSLDTRFRSAGLWHNASPLRKPRCAVRVSPGTNGSKRICLLSWPIRSWLPVASRTWSTMPSSTAGATVGLPYEPMLIRLDREMSCGSASRTGASESRPRICDMSSTPSIVCRRSEKLVCGGPVWACSW
jgi:hypothetical protein